MKTIFLPVIFSFAIGGVYARPDMVFISHKGLFDNSKPYTTDTIVFETPVAGAKLYGTTVLPWTANPNFQS